MLKTTNKGLQFIKSFEGFNDKMYICPAGKQTIGYGHVVVNNNLIAHATQQDLEKIFIEDVKQVECDLQKHIAVSLEPHQWDALVSLVYNLGITKFLNCKKLYQAINSQNMPNIHKEWSNIVYSNKIKLKGLVRRRKAELDLFFNNQYN